MITGQAGCMAANSITDNMVEEAKRRLSKFLFVGLLVQWDLSVCLFNYITTGKRFILPHQVLNNQPTFGKASTRYNRSQVPYDHADEEVYAAAVARFRVDTAMHNI